MDTAPGKPPIPNRVRELRERAGMTLAELSEKTGITVQMLSRLERGERVLTEHTLNAIAAAFKVKKAFLLNEVNAPGIAATQGDFVENELEAMLLKVWRPLSLDAKVYIFKEMSGFATARIDAMDARVPAAVNE